MKKTGPLKTTRLFSLQLADHDSLFAPRGLAPVNTRLRYAKMALVLLPALTFFLLPSFKIGKGLHREPGYELPNEIRRGELFTIPADDKTRIPLAGARPLSIIEGKQPVFIGAAVRGEDFDISFEFREEAGNPLKALVERLQHPTYPLFVKHVHVIDDTREADSKVSEASRGKGDKALKIAPSLGESELKALLRHDGNARLRCWKEPTVEIPGIDPLKPRKHLRLGNLSASAQGEVVYSGPSEGEDSVVILYHGGGFFSRYWNLKETRVQKGAKVSVGQTVGMVPLNSIKRETRPTWQVFSNQFGFPGEINPQKLLALSSQLCDSK